MGAKRIQVSADNITYYTLPGSSGDTGEELNKVKSTIFGQNFESEDPSLGQWAVSANGIWKGVAGYLAVLKKPGTPTVMTAEACALVSGKIYRITAATKRVISYLDSLTVLDNAVDHTADVLSIDYLSGKITFKASYTPTGPITVTGKYIPLAVIASAKSFTVTQNAAEIDKTTYAIAQANSGLRAFDPGLASVQLEVSGIYALGNANRAEMLARGIIYIEISPNGGTDTVFRGFFKGNNRKQSGNVGALEEETMTFSLWVPDGSLVELPFSWYFTASTLNMALQVCLNAWQTALPLYVKYLSDGTTGFSGAAIVTQATMSNSLDGLNEFKFNFRGSDAQTVI